MQVQVGKHKGKSVELMVLKEPGYVQWLLQMRPSGPLLTLQNEVRRLLGKFDAKPFLTKCFVKNCSSHATRVSVYGKSVSSPYFWCDECDPYDAGAVPGKLQIFRSYSSALSHVELYCSGRQADFKDLIKAIAQAKGLGARVGESQALAFF